MNGPVSSQLLIVLSAPSGGGKTTLCQHLLAAEPKLSRAITCTTRLPRGEERDGADYYFLDTAAFEREVAAGAFLEYARVHGRCYGTRRSEVLARLEAGYDVILNIDVQGAATLRAKAQSDPGLARALVTVFLAPPCLNTLRERLARRSTDDPAEIARRLVTARQELSHAGSFDYVIISSTIPEDVRRMQTILQAEKLRCSRVSLPDYDALAGALGKTEPSP